MSETALARDMRKAVEQFGGRMLRLHSGRTKVRGGWMHHNAEGCPDWLVMLPRGRSFLAEIKTREKRSKPSPEQLLWHAWAARAGYTVEVPRTVSEMIAACVKAMK